MIKVLIADDHQLLIDGITTTLEDEQNIEIVAGVNNGKQVLDYLKNNAVDIILMDINMPEMDGLECTKTVLKEFPNCKIIAISQYNERRLIKQMVKNGASGYLLKDSSKRELVGAINSVASGFPFFSDRLSTNPAFSLDKKKKPNPLFFSLTEREKEILILICKEFSSQEISEKLMISFHTVESHRANLMLKSGAKNSIGLMKWAIENDLVKL